MRRGIGSNLVVAFLCVCVCVSVWHQLTVASVSAISIVALTAMTPLLDFGRVPIACTSSVLTESPLVIRVRCAAVRGSLRSRRSSPCSPRFPSPPPAKRTFAPRVTPLSRSPRGVISYYVASVSVPSRTFSRFVTGGAISLGTRISAISAGKASTLRSSRTSCPRSGATFMGLAR